MWRHNLVENIVVKFTKLIKIGFSMERFAVIFLQFGSTTLKIWLLASQVLLAINFKHFWNFLKISQFA